MQILVITSNSRMCAMTSTLGVHRSEQRTHAGLHASMTFFNIFFLQSVGSLTPEANYCSRVTSFCHRGCLILLFVVRVIL
jgi:hypothetical protein